MQKRISQPVAFIVGLQAYLPLQYYTPMEVHTNKAWKNKCAVSCTYRRMKHNFTSTCFFQFQNEAESPNRLESKKVKRSLV